MSSSSLSELARTYLSGELFKDDPSWTKIKDSSNNGSSTSSKNVQILLYEPKYSIRMYRTSFVILFFGIFCSIYFGPYCSDLTIPVIIVGLTSINYWKHPVFGIRRTLDMICAQSGVVYHLYCAYCELDIHNGSMISYRWIYWLGFLTTILPLYSCAIYNGLNKNFDMSSRCHSGMHVAGIPWNIFLYSCLFAVRSNTTVTVGGTISSDL